MKLQNLILTGLLLLISVPTLSAQSALPSPQDDSCWSSLSALHACQLQAYDQAQEQAQEHAQNCTSYPEFQCNDYYQPKAKPSKAATRSNSSQNETQPTAAGIPPVAPDNVQTSGAN